MNGKQKVGEYFTAGELRLTDAPADAVAAMTLLVGAFLDPLRRRLARSIRITSGYRDAERNKAAGGVDDGTKVSQHTKGEAVDFKVAGYTADALATEIVRSGLPFDQLIVEAPERGGHCHVSFTTSRANRRQTLYAPAGGGYVPWTPPKTSA